MKHVIYIISVLLLCAGHIYGQIDCASLRKTTLNKDFDLSYSAFVTSKNESLLNLYPYRSFSSEKGDIYVTTLKPGICHVEKYNSELQLLGINTFEIEMSNSRTYFGIKQLGENIYLIYIDREKKEESNLICQLIDPENLKLSAEKTVLLSSAEDIDFVQENVSKSGVARMNLTLYESPNNNFLCICIESDPVQHPNTQFLIKVVNKNLEEEYSVIVETGIKSEILFEPNCIVADDGRVVVDVGIWFNPKQNGWDIESNSTRKLYLLSSTSTTVTVLTIETQTAKYTVENLIVNFAADKIYCFATLMKAGVKRFHYDSELLVYDFDSGALLKEFPTELFNHLDETAVQNYNQSAKAKPEELSREFTPVTFDFNPMGDIFLMFYGEGYQNPNSGFSVRPVAFMVLDSAFNIKKTDLFFSSSFIYGFFVQGNSFHLYLSSHTPIISALNIPYKESLIENQKAFREDRFFLSDVRLDPDGKFQITDIKKICADDKDKIFTYTLNYHLKSNRYVVIGKTAEKDPVYKLISFKIN